MSAIYLDGFDHYGSAAAGANAMLNGSWAELPGGGGTIGVPAWGSRTGLYSLESGIAGNGRYRLVLPAPVTNLFMSFGFSVNGLPSLNNANWLCDFRDNSNTVIASVRVESTGAISLIAANGSTVLGTTQGPVILSQNWHFIELNFDQAGGVFTLRVDDAGGGNTPAIHLTGQTFTGAVAQLGFLEAAEFGSVSSWLDDLFVRDATGSINNTFLGDRRVATLFADADTTVEGWTPSYYKEFGPGILTLGHKIPNNSAVQNDHACLFIPASSAFDIGNSAFTLETMVRWDQLPSASAYSTLFSRWSAGSNDLSYRLIYGGASFNGSCIQFDTSTDGTSGTLNTPILYPWTPELNTWYHIALVRSAGELLLFVDGQQLGVPISDSSVYHNGSPDLFVVGAQVDTSGIFHTILDNTNVAGRLDETRFTNGYARYTGPFTPPSSAFPRGSGSDPHWSLVTLLMGYDLSIADESSFANTVTPKNGAAEFTPGDGASVGIYSTLNKPTPDDNTFVSASFLAATNILTMTTQPSPGDTVTVGTKNGSTPAVYTFRASVPSAFDVLIDTSAQNTLMNLLNAINAGVGSGTKYGTGTTSNFDVVASQLPPGQIEVTASASGSAGNSIASTDSGAATAWLTSTLTGGTDIPGPADFKVQRLPSDTTLISAVQITTRSYKSDSGVGSFDTSFIGPLGGLDTGPTHALTVNPVYYNDIYEEDPDTSGPISPTTIINGGIQINRIS